MTVCAHIYIVHTCIDFISPYSNTLPLPLCSYTLPNVCVHEQSMSRCPTPLILPQCICVHEQSMSRCPTPLILPQCICVHEQSMSRCPTPLILPQCICVHEQSMSRRHTPLILPQSHFCLPPSYQFMRLLSCTRQIMTGHYFSAKFTLSSTRSV